MKVVLAIVLCVGCSLLAYIVGHWKGYSLGARLETSGAMSFLMVARDRLENGETAPALEAIDKGLDAQSGVLLKLEAPGPKPGMLGNAFGAGSPEKLIADMRGQFVSIANHQRTPLPEKMYQLLKLPVVPGTQASSASGTMPMIPAPEGGTPSPAPSPGATTAPTPAPNSPQLPPGVERRQR